MNNNISYAEYVNKIKKKIVDKVDAKRRQAPVSKRTEWLY